MAPPTRVEMGLDDYPFVGLAVLSHHCDCGRRSSFVALEPTPSGCNAVLGWTRSLLISEHTTQGWL